MLYLKSCPKCRGDMYLERDNFGSYRQCLQCGKTEDTDAPSPMLASVAAAETKVGRRGRKPRKNAAAA